MWSPPDEGLIRRIGCTGHRSSVLIEALKRFDFEIILVPMNIAEREPLEQLLPLCAERGTGVTVMKPVATGLLPSALALKWLLNQPIATAVPGAATSFFRYSRFCFIASSRTIPARRAFVSNGIRSSMLAAFVPGRTEKVNV